MTSRGPQLAIASEQLGALRTRRDEALAELVAWLRGFEVATMGGREYAERASDLVDEVVGALATLAIERLELEIGLEARAAAGAIQVVALGGYGRRELCPYSDIDLLFLLPERAREDERWAQASASFIDMVLYALWDLRYEVGHSARTIGECLEVAAEDPVVKTSLMEARPVGTVLELFGAFEAAVEARFLSKSEAEILIAQKLEEASSLRERYGGTIYLLEPEVKHGQGGLRDLHVALWVARARWRTKSLVDLSRQGIIGPREARAWSRAYGFLLRVRTELHLLAGRRRDSLGFDHQEAIAQTLGYLKEGEEDPRRKRHGVERFMRAYYFHARHNRRISELVIERATSHPRERPVSTRSAPGGFKTFDGMLSIWDRQHFEREPQALMRIFRVAENERLELYSYTKDLITGSLALVDHGLRRDPNVVGDFLAVLEGSDDGAALELMHDLGLLRRFMPELGRISSRWQHSLYHVYTVDVHSLFVVRELKRLRHGFYAESLPELTRIVADLPRPTVLLMAGLLHDVGKGWLGGDHSSRGAGVASVIGLRFEAAGLGSWTARETRDLEWLVQEHLAMSNISQRRDLSDPDLIREFAESCESLERLKMLYALTVADMKATSPKVWNEWKRALLSELYASAKRALSGVRPSEGPGALEEKREQAVEAILGAARLEGQELPRDLVVDFCRAVPPRYLLRLPADRMVGHIAPWREVSARGSLSLHSRALPKGITELTIVCPDRAGLLALLAGTLTAHRFQILSAEIFSIDLRAGEGAGASRRAALDVIHVRDVAESASVDAGRISRLGQDLRAVVAGERTVEEVLGERATASRLAPKPRPRVETKVVVVPDASQTDTVLDVFCQDHLGALATIARALADQGLSIRLAKISTEGDRVADGFYVTDAKSGERIEDDARIQGIVRAVQEAIDRALKGNGERAQG